MTDIFPLLRSGDITAASLARAAGLPLEDVYAQLAHLESLGQARMLRRGLKHGNGFSWAATDLKANND